jgi:hypothetical protein
MARASLPVTRRQALAHTIIAAIIQAVIEVLKIYFSGNP